MSTRAQAIVAEAGYIANLYPTTSLATRKRIEERLSALYDHALASVQPPATPPRSTMTHKPGTIAHVRRKPDPTRSTELTQLSVLRYDHSRAFDFWEALVGDGPHSRVIPHDEAEVVRIVPILDTFPDLDWPRVVEMLRENGNIALGLIAEAIEKQVGPPPLAEPEEFGARVMATRRGIDSNPRLWIRMTRGSTPGYWTDGRSSFTWDGLAVTEILS
jgi:hypothetical protein